MSLLSALNITNLRSVVNDRIISGIAFRSLATCMSPCSLTHRMYGTRVLLLLIYPTYSKSLAGSIITTS
jgi:hypothetical protein